MPATTYCGHLTASIGPFAEGGATATLRTHPHAFNALRDRWQGVPVMAPVFHVAIGFGFAAGLSLTGAFDLGRPIALWRYFVAMVLTSPLSLLFDLVPTLGERNGVSRQVSAPLIIVLAAVLPVLLFPARTLPPAAAAKPDYLLFTIPLLNHGYFATFAWRHGVKISPELQAFVVTLALLAMATHRRACLLVPVATARRPKTE